jgi:hypothetical protein
MLTAPANDRSDEILLLEVNPTGDLALVLFPGAMNRLQPPFFGLVNLATGEIGSFEQSTDIEAGFVYDATFAPDNRLILLERIPGGDQSEDDVRLLARQPGEIAFTVLADRLPEARITPLLQSGLTVLPDSWIAYPSPREDDLIPWTIVSFDGQTPATPDAVTTFAVGATVVTTVETPLRATPAADGVMVLLLPAGAELIIIAPPVEIDGIVWWPVRELESGALGYIPHAYLTAGNG